MPVLALHRSSRSRSSTSRSRAAKWILSTFSLLIVLSLLAATPASAFRASFAANTIASGTFRASGANSASTLVLTTTVAAPAGSVIVVSGAANNATASTPTFTVSDSAANTYTTQLQGCGGPGVAALDGVCGFVATTRITNQLAIGATITVTLSAANTRIVANAQFFSGVAEVLRASATSNTTTATSTTPSATTATVNAGDIVIGVAAVEDGSNTLTVDSDTTNGTWSTNTLAATSNGAGLSEVMVNTQYKEATAAGSQTYNLTTTSADNWTAILVLNRMATPEAVTDLAATPQNTQVALTWTAAASNDSPITDYVIEYKLAASPTWLVFADGTSSATSATVTGLTNGSLYDFRVTGVNAIGTSDITAPTVQSTPRTVPTAPTGVSASSTASTKSMAISWTAPTSNGGASISGYTVIDQNDTTICTTNGPTSCTVSDLTSNTSYTFRVFATNVAGNSANSTASASTLQTSIPNAPTALRVIAARYRFILDWTAPASNGFALTSYTATATSGATTRSCTVSAASTRCILSGFPTTQASYTISVTAKNTYGDSAASASVVMPTWFTPSTASPADLRGMDLSGLDLSFAMLKNVNLSGVSLAGSNLTGAWLIGSDISGTNFSGTTLTNLISSQNTGTPVNLPNNFALRTGAIIGPNVNLSWQNLAGIDFSGLTLANINFTRSDLTGANFSNAVFQNANFTNATLTNANFTSANLTGANFASATVSGAQFATANLTRARSGSVVGTPASLPARSAVVAGFIVTPRATLISANLAAADLSSLDLTGANLTGANLTGANLTSTTSQGTSFMNATLTNANLTGVSVTSSTFTNANLNGATFSSGSFLGANLTGVSMTSASLQGANFTNANFTNANLNGSTISTANLTGANFTGTNLTSTDLSAANLTRLRSNGVVGSPTLPANSRMVDGYIVAAGVNLTGATLTGHDLRSLNLTGTIFTNANLHGAKFDNSNLLRANFKDAAVNQSSTFNNTSGRPAVLPSGYHWYLNSLQKQ